MDPLELPKAVLEMMDILNIKTLSIFFAIFASIIGAELFTVDRITKAIVNMFVKEFNKAKNN